MKRIFRLVVAGGILLSASCNNYYDIEKDPITYGQTYFKPVINTDKAVYKPGEKITFTAAISDNNLSVAYTYLGELIKEEPLSQLSWTWTPPTTDFRGYMVYLFKTDDTTKKPLYSIAVDVSSDWRKFPRYGFVSNYDRLDQQVIQRNVETLNRFHINGIQFYDWQMDQHKPLAGSVSNPADSWLDLIGRTNYKSTVDGYIQAAHDRGMKAMFYNLLYGALSNAASDGVSEQWYLFKDNQHQEKDRHSLNAPFRSNIYLVDPGNSDWQTYINKRHQDVFAVYNFDGYHIDQLGDRGKLYDYTGKEVKLEQRYAPFIAASKKAFPGKYHVMNAVNQYGQESGIAPSAVDFLYTEVWDPNKSYDELVKIIQDNDRFSNYNKNTVLAAYMNYAKSNQAGFVNEPGVLLTNAVIFANGGAHLEMGEHYLTNEYFANNNLQLKGTTKEKLIQYYDFMVAYQNVLRDGGTAAVFSVTGTNALTISNGKARSGSITSYGRYFANRDVIHLINFKDANTMEWRDTNGTQQEPSSIDGLQIKLDVTRTVKRVWLASPDMQGGVAIPLTKAQTGNKLTIDLPGLKYWDMVVIEY